MADGPHHSIGEVLSLLKEEHADITISKIRFLESQGLIDPERTPSGYRKFYQDDVDRLRWILTQQRDNFLPLKVIKRRLAEEGFDPVAEIGERPATSPLPEPSLFAQRDDVVGAESESAAVEPMPETAREPASVEAADPELALEPEASAEPHAAVATESAEPEAAAAPDPAEPEAEAAPEPAEPEAEAAPEAPQAAELVAAAEPVATPASSSSSSSGSARSASLGSVSLTAADLAEAAGADLGMVGELEKLGLIEAVSAQNGSVFDHEALLVTKAAVACREAGMEIRHLRMYKVAADREAGLLLQLRAAALAKGGAASADARAELAALVSEGETIHRSLLRRTLGLDLEH